MTLQGFADVPQLLEFAERFFTTRLDSLERDIERCLREPPPAAPFPAVLYCFSIIDLLGALYAGRADRSAPTTQQAAAYMKSRFMGYTDEQVRLLQNIFRHKLVHFSEPKAVIEDDGRLVSWRIEHESSPWHLRVTPQAMEFFISQPGWSVAASHEFVISIRDLVRDIRESVLGAGRYRDSLQADATLQRRFERALVDIFDPGR